MRSVDKFPDMKLHYHHYWCRYPSMEVDHEPQICVKSSMRFLTSQEQDVSGAYYHNPFRHGQLYKDIFTSGPRRVYWPK